MKSLSDYTKILRDTATNLNLHGESVEMVVQMLANALYISEVEHVSYSQEASLERATQENSKIQHCVNQMYSVYRGANPRVILNIKSSKIFEFKTHQEIIKSNNYKVYYLGYYDHDLGVTKYSDLTIYPDNSATIIGLMARDIISRSWTVGEENSYYYTIPESDLSGDLYLEILGERKDVTRIFSDHLKNDISFDLTLPGYGMRLYYPESLQGTPGVNTSYSLSVYKRMLLSEIQESERKAIKMNGSQLVNFPESILRGLGASETYPGVIFIPETPHDAIDTVHFKANRQRYSGTYLATNSDLSWLLQEYYPSKIRRLGVTYRFDSPKSTRLETIQSSKKIDIKPGNTPFIRFADLRDSLKDWVSGSLGYLPEGEIRFRYKRAKEITGTNASYEILPSASVIPVRAAISYLSPTVSEISVRVLKNTSGVVKLITTPEELRSEGLTLTYRFPDRMESPLNITDSLKITRIENNLSSTSDQPLEISLTKGGKEVDKETIPFTYIPVIIGKVELKEDPEDSNKVTSSYMTVTEEGPGDYYTLDLQEDTLYLKTNQIGEVIGISDTFATLYYNGKQVSGVSYSLIQSSDIEASIDSSTGRIEVTGMSSEVLSSSLIVRARYNGMNFQNLLVCKKTISNLDSTGSVVSFSVYSDLSPDEYPILTLPGYSELKEATITIPKNKYKSLTMKGDGVVFEGAEYVYSWETVNNILSEGVQTTPTLKLYYIPNTDSNPLDSDEITKFIEDNKSYYITQDISIEAGRSIIAKFDVSLDLYRNSTLDGTVLEILQRYSYLFGQDFGGTLDGGERVFTDTYYEIKSLITKVSEVKNVDDIKVTYLNSTTREEISYYKDVKNSDTPVYFIVECVISSIVKE